MRNPFTKQPSTGEAIYRPVPGRLLRLDDVPDPVFAGRSLGDGFAVIPQEGDFRAPADGVLVLLADTLHAYAVRTAAGAEILVHIGLDTVTLRGAGFCAHTRQGSPVLRGEPVISCDLADVSSKVPSMITPVILLNGSGFTNSEPVLTAAPDQRVLTVRPR